MMIVVAVLVSQDARVRSQVCLLITVVAYL